MKLGTRVTLTRTVQREEPAKQWEALKERVVFVFVPPPEGDECAKAVKSLAVAWIRNAQMARLDLASALMLRRVTVGGLRLPP